MGACTFFAIEEGQVVDVSELFNYMQVPEEQNASILGRRQNKPDAFFRGWAKILAEHHKQMLGELRHYCAKMHLLSPGRGYLALVEDGVQLYENQQRNAEAAAAAVPAASEPALVGQGAIGEQVFLSTQIDV